MSKETEKRIADMVKDFDAKCGKAGHTWVESSIFPGIEYCQACGVSRARVKVEI